MLAEYNIKLLSHSWEMIDYLLAKNKLTTNTMWDVLIRDGITIFESATQLDPGVKQWMSSYLGMKGIEWIPFVLRNQMRYIRFGVPGSLGHYSDEPHKIVMDQRYAGRMSEITRYIPMKFNDAMNLVIAYGLIELNEDAGVLPYIERYCKYFESEYVNVLLNFYLTYSINIILYIYNMGGSLPNENDVHGLKFAKEFLDSFVATTKTPIFTTIFGILGDKIVEIATNLGSKIDIILKNTTNFTTRCNNCGHAWNSYAKYPRCPKCRSVKVSKITPKTP